MSSGSANPVWSYTTSEVALNTSFEFGRFFCGYYTLKETAELLACMNDDRLWTVNATTVRKKERAVQVPYT